MSSLVAKDRLRRIIAADRAAVPCGRWVKCFPRLKIWQMGAEQAAFFGHPIPPLPTGKALWPRYRYEVRR